jgi:hydrogenase/urease accessory protein HupE
MNTGFGPFYDGLAHPLVTAEDLLPVIALALLAGLGGVRPARAAVFVLPAAWLVGMVLGRAVPPPAAGAWVVSVLTVALGALVAADRKLPLPVVAGTSVFLGLAHGWGNGAALANTGAGITGPLGVACTVFVVMTLIAGGVVSFRAPWTRIGVRVAGSWIAAIGLLMLGWSVRMSGLPT